MKYLHTMVRITDISASLNFYCNNLGLVETHRHEYPQGKFTLIFLAAPDSPEAELELTYNWEPETYEVGRNFGHLAFEVENIYSVCDRLIQHGVTIFRPPRDGRLAFVKSPDQISVELLQKGEPLAPCEPWKSMPNAGVW